MSGRRLIERLFNKDVLAGAFFIAVGIAGAIIGWSYPMGTPLRMGAGYFPRLLCWLLVGLGALIAVKGMLGGGSLPDRLHVRPLVCISAALVAFALLLSTAGIVVAVLAVVLIGAVGGPEFRSVEAVPLAIVLAAAAVGLFVFALGMPFKLLPF